MIRLEPFEESDIPRLISWVTTPRLMTQWAAKLFQFPLDHSQLTTHVKIAKHKGPILQIYRAVDPDSNQVVGHIELGQISGENQCATVSRVLVGDSQSRGKGVGQDMMREIVKIGFDELNLHRLDLYVYDQNHAAIRCYERAGFVKEGLLRDRTKFEGEFWSAYIMSRINEGKRSA